MNSIERYLSRPTAKPYRNGKIEDTEPTLDKNGNITFSPDDVENPKNWSVGRRIFITFTAVSMVLNATFASSSPSGSLEGLAEYFQVSREAAALVVTLFLLGYVAGPLVFAPLSEHYGRRYIFIITFFAYVAFNFLCAFPPNFAALLIGRLLTGTCSSAALTNAPGVIADLWGPIARGNAVAGFSMITFIGPALGPVISGFLQLTKGDRGWQWTFYVLIMLGGATIIPVLTIPETYQATVLINKAKRIRALNPAKYGHLQAPAEAQGRSLATLYRVALIRPWQILFDPISFLVAIYISVVYTLLYMLFTIYPIVFQQKRHWNPGVGELPLLGTVVGALIGGCIVFWQSHRDQAKANAGYVRKAEDRLPLAQFAGITFAITMFWFSWSAEYNSVHWIVPSIAGVFLATSIQLIFVAYINYLTDAYLMYTASAMAANTITRSACGAAAPLFTEQMFNALGVGGGGSLIGGVAVLLAPIPFAFYKYGEGIRIKSKFAPTFDAEAKKPEPEKEEKEKDVEAQSGVLGRRSQEANGSSSTLNSGAVRDADKEDEARGHRLDLEKTRSYHGE
jgi:MFS transporter, DHA1 family, multidrug resistance protein